ncbi:tetratricopeptide repeat protein [Caulifigura coniformis]|nr:tetratricopeptide repeat protein [Caulifigura coniformis]
MARIFRGTLTVAGVAWICIASTLCGCGSVNGYVMNESGKAYYRRGDYTAARHEFERALMDSPENPNYAYNVAAAMQQQGDVMAAEKMYQHALVIDPGHESSYEGLAHLLYNNDRTGEAEQLLTAWSDTQPYDENSSLTLARMQDNMGNTAGADMSYDRALAANPRSRRANRRRDSQMAGYRGQMQNPYSSGMQPDSPMMADGQSPALLMAQQMPMYDPTFQPGPMPFQSYAPPAGVPQAPYIGSANIAQQSPSIYRGTYGPQAGVAFAPPTQWGTPATVPMPPSGLGQGGMMAAQQPTGYGASGTAFFSAAPTPAWSPAMAATPMMAPQMAPQMAPAPYSPAPSAPGQVIPASGAMPMPMQQPVYGSQPTMAQPMVVPAF